jgi:predicted Zn-dependent protease
VVVTTGLLKKITNEAQLAGVLGHEISHVTLRHALQTYKKAKLAQCTVALTAGYYADHSTTIPDFLKEPLKFSKKFGPGGKVDLDAPDDDGFVPFVIDKVMDLADTFGNAKEDELAADHASLELLAFAGYDATEYEALLSSLGSQGGGFSKHPSTADRLAGLKAARESDELKPFMTGKAKPDVAKKFAALK